MGHPLKKHINNQILFQSLAKKFGTPLYVYDKNQLVSNIKSIDGSLKKHFEKYHICYTIKANNNPNIINALKSNISDLGADCSSPGELHAAKLGGISNNNCIYTGNYESEEDLRIALESGANINLDDVTSFHRLRKIGIPKEISFRLNPGFGKGAFKGITTGGEDSKFGIPKEKILQAYKTAKNSGVRSFGIQCMTGSGVLDSYFYPKLISAILKTVNHISRELKIKFRYISMGGGFGIPYEDHQKTLDLDTVFEKVSNIFNSNFESDIPEFWIEPGRSVVGNAGILLSKVTAKKNSYKSFIGLDAGMETLMRPALYGASHRIYKLGSPNPVNTKKFDFTGRICENTDRLGTNICFPDVNEGELILIMDVGAYGFTMSHQFCGRPKAAEVMLADEKAKLIRRRESIEDLFHNCIF